MSRAARVPRLTNKQDRGRSEGQFTNGFRMAGEHGEDGMEWEEREREGVNGCKWSCARGCAERQAGGCLGAGSEWLRSKVETRVRVSIVEVEVKVEVRVEVEAEIGEVRRCGTTKVRDRIELRQESAGEGEMGSGMEIEWDGGDGRMVWYG